VIHGDLYGKAEGGRRKAELESAPEAQAGEETIEQKRARLTAELQALGDDETLTSAGAPPLAGEAPAAGNVAEGGSETLGLKLAPMPVTSAAPLVNVSTEAQFTAEQDAALAVQVWAEKHKFGGTLPASLAQQLENVMAARQGREPGKATGDLTISEDDRNALAEEALLTLNKHLPARRAQAQQETQLLAAVARETPTYYDGGQSEEGKLVAHVLATYPQLRTIPYWPIMVRHMARGYFAEKAAPASGTGAPQGKPALRRLPKPAMVPTTDGHEVPLAPSPAIGGLSVAGPRTAQRDLEQIMAKKPGDRSEDEWVRLSAAAV
jgi:hypothetical protein